jgi:hypothetical protein
VILEKRKRCSIIARVRLVLLSVVVMKDRTANLNAKTRIIEMKTRMISDVIYRYDFNFFDSLHSNQSARNKKQETDHEQELLLLLLVVVGVDSLSGSNMPLLSPHSYTTTSQTEQLSLRKHG